jgi:hypothetical protein
MLLTSFFPALAFSSASFASCGNFGFLRLRVSLRFNRCFCAPPVFSSSYARGYATMWEQFHWQIHNISQSTPWMAGDGKSDDTTCSSAAESDPAGTRSKSAAAVRMAYVRLWFLNAVLFCISHERDYPDSGSVYTGHDSGGECGVPYNHRWNFAMPHPTPSKLDETWWSVNYGPIHWITMSTEHAFKKGSAQHNWIMEDLKKVDRKITPFIIFCT